MVALNGCGQERPEERLVRVPARAGASTAEDTLADLVARGRARPILDPRSAEEILGYDAHGLPA